jgi:hypothetical protein
MNTLTPRQELIKMNLLKVISEINHITTESLKVDDIKIKITPVDEPGKPETNIDQLMNYWYRKNYDYSKMHSIEAARECITAPRDNFPLWIKIKADSETIFEFQISKRYRPYNMLANQENGYPPFEIIIL